MFGTKHERDVKRMRPGVDAINALEPAMQALSDVELRGQDRRAPQRLADGDDVETLLPEAFAACREAARRTVRMRHFDVQLMGGMVLHQGKIAEMATGEGKTLVATLPAYLNALPGRGTHVVTVNDYLARRDAQWMGPIYHALGLSVGVIQHEIAVPLRPDLRVARTSASRPSGRARGATRTTPTSPTAPTTSSGSTTCATTCASASRRWCSASTTTRSSTRWTRSSSTRRGPR